MNTSTMDWTLEENHSDDASTSSEDSSLIEGPYDSLDDEFTAWAEEMTMFDEIPQEVLEEEPLATGPSPHATDSFDDIKGKEKKVMFTFFQQKVFLDEPALWNKDTFAPNKPGKNEEYDEVLTKVGKDYAYGTRLWRSYRDRVGILQRTPRIVLGKEELLQKISSSVDIDVVKSATIASLRLNPMYYDQALLTTYLQVCEEDTTAIAERITHFNQILAEQMATMTESQMSSRNLNFLVRTQESSSSFVNSIAPSSEEEKESDETMARDAFYEYFDIELLHSWTVFVKQSPVCQIGGALECEFFYSVPQVDIRRLTHGSDDTIYYVAGFFLRKIRSKSKKSHRDMITQFVDDNRISNAADTRLKNLPVGQINRLEYKQGRLIRCTGQFFHFVRNLEALYIMNVTVGNAWHCRARLFMKIKKVASQSKQLRNLVLWVHSRPWI